MKLELLVISKEVEDNKIEWIIGIFEKDGFYERLVGCCFAFWSTSILKLCGSKSLYLKRILANQIQYTDLHSQTITILFLVPLKTSHVDLVSNMSC